jgi:hypothetical protein
MCSGRPEHYSTRERCPRRCAASVPARPARPRSPRRPHSPVLSLCWLLSSANVVVVADGTVALSTVALAKPASPKVSASVAQMMAEVLRTMNSPRNLGGDRSDGTRVQSPCGCDTRQPPPAATARYPATGPINAGPVNGSWAYAPNQGVGCPPVRGAALDGQGQRRPVGEENRPQFVGRIVRRLDPDLSVRGPGTGRAS